MADNKDQNDRAKHKLNNQMLYAQSQKKAISVLIIQSINQFTDYSTSEPINKTNQLKN